MTAYSTRDHVGSGHAVQIGRCIFTGCAFSVWRPARHNDDDGCDSTPEDLRVVPGIVSEHLTKGHGLASYGARV